MFARGVCACTGNKRDGSWSKARRAIESKVKGEQTEYIPVILGDQTQMC